MSSEIAGLDCGTDLIKAVWRAAGSYCFMSSRDNEEALIFAAMKAGGVKRARRVGFVRPILPPRVGLELVESEHDNAIIDLVKLEMTGARFLAQGEGIELDGHYLASVGTAVSYGTRLPDGDISKVPFGHAFGGRYVTGLANLLGIDRTTLFSDLAASGYPPALLVRDVLPQLGGSWLSDMVMSHFGVAEADTPPADVCAGLFDTVAGETAFQLFRVVVGSPPDHRFKEVIATGTLTRLPYFRQRLRHHFHKFGFEVYPLKLGEYAAAMGAYLDLLNQEQG